MSNMTIYKWHMNPSLWPRPIAKFTWWRSQHHQHHHAAQLAFQRIDIFNPFCLSGGKQTAFEDTYSSYQRVENLYLVTCSRLAQMKHNDKLKIELRKRSRK